MGCLDGRSIYDNPRYHVVRDRYSERLSKHYAKTDGCWGWMGTLTKHGYGQVRLGGILYPAHRVIYEHHVGRIAPGMVVMHLCDNPSCVRPDHLRCASQEENILDCHAKGRDQFTRRRNS